MFSFLGGYGCVTGAIAGVMITDFHVIRQSLLPVDEQGWPRLYETNGGGGDQVYRRGVNWRALVAVAAGIGPCAPGFVASCGWGSSASLPSVWSYVYSVSWFFATVVSSCVFWGLTWLDPPIGFCREGWAVCCVYGCTDEELQLLQGGGQEGSTGGQSSSTASRGVGVVCDN